MAINISEEEERAAKQELDKISEKLIASGMFKKDTKKTPKKAVSKKKNDQKKKAEQEARLRKEQEEARANEELAKKQAEEERIKKMEEEREQMKKTEEEKFENEFSAIIKEVGFSSDACEMPKEKKQLFIDLYYGNKKTSAILPKIDLLNQQEYLLTTKVVEQLVVRKFRKVCEKNGIDMTEEKISTEIQSVIEQKTQKYYTAIEEESKKQKRDFDARQVKEKKKMKKIAENIKI